MELLRSWNAFVKSLLATKRKWETLRALVETCRSTDFPADTPSCLLAPTAQSTFEVALPFCIQHIRRSGGFDEAFVRTSKKAAPEQQPIIIEKEEGDG